MTKYFLIKKVRWQPYYFFDVNVHITLVLSRKTIETYSTVKYIKVLKMACIYAHLLPSKVYETKGSITL